MGCTNCMNNPPTSIDSNVDLSVLLGLYDNTRNVEIVETKRVYYRNKFYLVVVVEYDENSERTKESITVAILS